jgi:outer membrane protein assembly factor BamA
MKKIIYFLLLISLALLSLKGFCSSIEEMKKSEAEPKKFSWIVLPVIFYTPETHWAGGVGGLFAFRPAERNVNTRPSSIYFAVIDTQLKQFSVEIKPEIYLNKEAYLLTAYLVLKKYPCKFYGIGNDTPKSLEKNYTPRTNSLELTLQKKIFPKERLYAGIDYQYERTKILKVDKDRLLALRDILGSQGGTVSGLGFVLNWDSRDNIFSTTKGNYWQVLTYFNSRTLGSDFNYNSVKADLRSFVPLFSSHVLALQGYAEIKTGHPPFYQLAKLGGEVSMRGYYLGRYRDKILMTFQAEYRIPAWWRFGLVGFAGVGDVASKFAKFKLADFKYSVGAGLRFLLDPTEGTCLRADFGFGKGTSGFYFTAGQAF